MTETDVGRNVFFGVLGFDVAEVKIGPLLAGWLAGVGGSPGKQEVSMRIFIGTLLLASSLGVSADQWLNGYTRQNGTYVNPYVRSNPNGTGFDNYSTKENTNPYTGERGCRSG
jgi:hypothetical protein